MIMPYQLRMQSLRWMDSRLVQNGWRFSWNEAKIASRMYIRATQPYRRMEQRYPRDNHVDWASKHTVRAFDWVPQRCRWLLTLFVCPSCWCASHRVLHIWCTELIVCIAWERFSTFVLFDCSCGVEMPTEWSFPPRSLSLWKDKGGRVESSSSKLIGSLVCSICCLKCAMRRALSEIIFRITLRVDEVWARDHCTYSAAFNAIIGGNPILL